MFFKIVILQSSIIINSQKKRESLVSLNKLEVQLHFKVTQSIYQLDLTKANFTESISEHFFSLVGNWLLFLLSFKITFSYCMEDQKSPQAICILLNKNNWVVYFKQNPLRFSNFPMYLFNYVAIPSVYSLGKYMLFPCNLLWFPFSFIWTLFSIRP